MAVTGDILPDEPRSPRRAVALELSARVVDAARVDRVEPSGPLGAHGREALLAQDAQLAGDRRLRDAELAADRRDHLAGARLPRGQQVEDPTSHRVAEDIERMHEAMISIRAYICRG